MGYIKRLWAESQSRAIAALVAARRPGIASAGRPRRGSFATLLDHILTDRGALDGLVFAYSELSTLERTELIRAVVRDARNPTHALVALLAVEEQPALRRRLAGLIGKHGRIERSAFVRGCEAAGDASLVHSIPGSAPEALRIAWKRGNIQHLEIRSLPSGFRHAAGLEVPVAEAVAIVAPMVWRHVQSGGGLPEGADRFAGFFSLT